MTTKTEMRKLYDLVDSSAILRPIMLTNGTVDALIETSFALDHETPERQEARKAAREYCVKYMVLMFDGGEPNMTLGDLAIALGFFYDGYRSGLKREVILD